MATRIFAADQPGNRYEFTTRQAPGAPALLMTIGRTRDQPLVSFVLASAWLKRIRMSFRPVQIGEDAYVRYLVASSLGVARAGYCFEFRENGELRSVFVGADGMEWLAGNPDSDAFQARNAFLPWEGGLLPC